MSHIETYYAMKHRLGGEKLSPREKLMMGRLHSCPGNIYHKVPRAEILFTRRVKFGHACYVMYWRSHPMELKLMDEATGRHYPHYKV